MDSEIIAAVANRLFGASTIRTDGLESMANAALQRGIDAFMDKDYEKAVEEFKRSVGIGRNSSFAADAAQYMAMSYLQMDDAEERRKGVPDGPPDRPLSRTTSASSWGTSTFPRKNTRTRARSTPKPCA